MKPEAYTALSVALQVGVPTLLIGPPGGGKTKTIESIALALNVPIYTLIGSILDPTDLSGLPYRTDQGVCFAPPWWVSQLASAPAPTNGGRISSILFLDELNSAPPPVQAGLLRVLSSGIVGDTPLPLTCVKIAAKNPEELSAGGVDLAPPLANRLFHLPFTTEVSEWTNGLMNGFPSRGLSPLPPHWESQLPMAQALVAGFVTASPNHLSEPPTDPKQAGEAWPSPRTWDLFSQCLGAAMAIHAPDEAIHTLAAGLVGIKAAMPFMTYRNNLDLPNPEDTLKRGAKFKLPARTDLHYVVLASMVSAILSAPTEERIFKGFEVLNAAADQQALAVASATMRPLFRHLSQGNVTENLVLFARIRKEFPFVDRTIGLLSKAGQLPASLSTGA